MLYQLHVWGAGEVHTGFWWRNPREKDIFEEVGVNGRVILKRVFKNGIEMAWNMFFWLSIVKIGGLQWTRYWTFGLQKILGTHRRAERILASQRSQMQVVNDGSLSGYLFGWFLGWLISYSYLRHVSLSFRDINNVCFLYHLQKKLLQKTRYVAVHLNLSRSCDKSFRDEMKLIHC